ncbi:hypothetical protein WN944_013965 [Citrus x changshan-huyou]|uniref:Uncharacterized protein n=1 Tax=Citrus x changshan-huyou TaxID=2935761 RepID=A0AAP0M612_9ROSI
MENYSRQYIAPGTRVRNPEGGTPYYHRIIGISCVDTCHRPKGFTYSHGALIKPVAIKLLSQLASLIVKTIQPIYETESTVSNAPTFIHYYTPKDIMELKARGTKPTKVLLLDLTSY